jgi:hypothetical protein
MLDIEGIQKKPLVKVWEQMYEKISSMISERLKIPLYKWNKYLSEECIKILCKGLENIRLYES